MPIWQSETSDVEILSHYEVETHRGNLFSANHLFTAIADTNSAEMIGITGSKSVDLTVLVKSTGGAELEFEVGTTFTDNGTEITDQKVNRNELSSKTAVTAVYYSPTVNTAGTVFSEGLIPGGGDDESQIGGEAGQGSEFIVAPNTNHLLRVTNTSGSDSKILIEYVWYEE